MHNELSWWENVRELKTLKQLVFDQFVTSLPLPHLHQSIRLIMWDLAVKIEVVVFWVAVLCSVVVGSTVFWNTGFKPPHYMHNNPETTNSIHLLVLPCSGNLYLAYYAAFFLYRIVNQSFRHSVWKFINKTHWYIISFSKKE